ncbi:MAG: 5'-methylthioadenosine/adenosylhomocysteine nucleosidase, partial [Clostridiaceae bacterium]|nr:5'-methylthioadenosine/adenosylhomocysteine nucleosidase [Clostridiaceae bacterium]
MKKAGIIGAMKVEITLLLNAMRVSGEVIEKTIGKNTFYEGQIAGCNVILVQCGIGKVNAAVSAQILVSVFSVDFIINTGIAGSLSSGLQVLDIVISTDTLYHDFDVTGFGYPDCTIPGMDTSIFLADKHLIELAVKAYQSGGFKQTITTGRIATGDIFVASKNIKNAIIKKCKPLCVEMEGAAVAHTAFLNNIPFVII